MVLNIIGTISSFLLNGSVGFNMALVAILLIGVLIFLYVRYIHIRKRAILPKEQIGMNDILGPLEWEQQMQELAKKHQNVKLMRYNFVLGDYNKIAYKKLNQIRNSISEISSDLIALIPAARWLFDNYQMLYREIKKVRTTGTSYEILPILRTKEYHGYPRIYVVAKKMVAISGGHLNEENMSIMIQAYQKEIHLIDKELWVLPEMIGFCLLESIIEVAEEVVRIVKIKAKAERFVKGKLGVQPGVIDITSFLSEVDTDCRKNFSFHAHVIYQLKNMSFEEESIQRYVAHHYKSKSVNKRIKPSKVFLEESKLESYLESDIRALIVSLKGINETDEEKFFEAFSLLESILLNDPDDVYAKMDSVSKGMYRGIIVKLSIKHHIEEGIIAEYALELAKAGREDLNCPHHVGTYLIGKGYPLLKAKVLNKKAPENLEKKQNIKGISYFITGFLLVVSVSVFVIFMMKRFGFVEDISLYVIVLVVGLPMLTGIAIELTNHIFTRRMAVAKIPSLDYLEEIPDHSRTFLVMPVLVSSKSQCIEYLERLEKHYLANRQDNLYFGLLADFEDAPEKVMPKDEILEKVLIKKINALNALYPSTHQRFSLFIRERLWNQSENCHMGWERKRGKLEEFNNLLSGIKKEDTSFVTLLCDEVILETFKYVITLDADSNLIRDNASKLVGLIDHPLNQPVIDPVSKRVKEGYAIIQPSIGNHIVDKKSSRFPEVFGGKTGLANYSSIQSDIYQDVFNEGVYTGKGIYHVEAFHLILNKIIPDNSVLSHDLLESCYVKTAFSSSVKIMDTFPSSVLSFVKREHRWIRGDWQLLPWLFKRKPKNGISLNVISKWKILDNLRRSIVPVSKTLFIIINLAIMPKVFYLWLPLVFFSDILNFASLLYAIISQKINRPQFTIVYKGLFKEIMLMFERALMELVITPYRAQIATDAIMRTVFRVLISQEKMLRWNTSENEDASVVNTLRGYFFNMFSAIIAAMVLVGLLIVQTVHPVAIAIYGALALAWGMSFWMAYRMSQPREERLIKGALEDRELLLETARRTWLFFKDHATKDNNYLCPDNYQYAPKEKLSNKTSPTNIGLQLLATLSARDFGFETLSTMIAHEERLLETIGTLPKWKGHLYNWYNTSTLEILHPDYISTVDSGNFFGHLIALKNGILEQLDTPIFTTHLISELRHTLKTSQTNMLLKDDYGTIGEFSADLSDIRALIKSNEQKLGERSHRIGERLSSLDIIINEVEVFNLEDIPFSDCPTLGQLALEDNDAAKDMVSRIKVMSHTIDSMLKEAEFRFLYNEKRLLFHIGYHVSSQTKDAGCYDLMASESSLTSFIAIARGEVPLKHWSKLGRPFTMIDGIPSFVSWSGTMFEYLMPNLVMKEYDGSVYAETSKAAVLQHINYAKHMSIPWGISESQYYRFDLDANYQYKAFGIPKLRLQPALKEPLVVAPYATFLALEYENEEAMSNLRRMSNLGAFSTYGYYEAIDFNGPDPEYETPYCIVRSFMAHHQGMNLVAINNYLNNGIMRSRFHAEAMVKATEVLLEEKRQSHFISIAKRGYTIKIRKMELEEDVLSNRYVNSVAPEIAVVRYFSNNNYSLMITSDGDGFSSYNDMMLYRWRSDLYANTGNYIYIKDMNKNSVWSTTYNPTKKEPEDYEAIFHPHKAEFKRTDGDIITHTEVSLSPNYNLEIRKVTLTNNGKGLKQLELTSYMEVVGDRFLAELSHPAFNKLFIESEYIEEHGIFLSRRRSNKEGNNPYLMHMVKTDVNLSKNVAYENDRLKFIGRNNTLMNPVTVVDSILLSNSTGFCNDPIMSLRVNIALAEGESTSVSFITGVSKSKEEAIAISDELSIDYRIDDMFEKFRLQSAIELKYLDISRKQLNAFQDLISPLFYPSGYYRGPAENIRRNWKNQSFLWKFGVSGDNPIMLLTVKSIEAASVIRDVLKAYEYLRINQVKVDLIILSEAKHGYIQELHDLLNDMTSSLRIYDESRERPSLFILHSNQVIPAELDLLFTVARVVFTEKTGIYFRNIKETLKEIIEDVVEI